MRIHSLKFFILFSLLFFMSTLLATGKVLAKGGELKFYSQVTAIAQSTENEGVVTILVKGIDVNVLVNGDTEIEENGIEIGLGNLPADSFVKMTAFFSDLGLIAEEITLVDAPYETFRFRGYLTDVMADVELPPGLEFDNTPAIITTTGLTLVSLLGSDVYINGNTRITSRGRGHGNQLPVSALEIGDKVDIHGTWEGVLLASRIHVGSREQGGIEVDGTVSELTDAGFVLDIKGGGKANVLLDDTTEVNGSLLVGSYVEVEGMLTQSLAILADEVVVDEDGDGDGDDDHSRGNLNRGNNGNGNGNGRPAWTLDQPGSQRTEVALIAADDPSLHARVKIRDRDGDRSFELKLTNGEPESTYTVVAWFETEAVEFGSFVTNRQGKATLEYEDENGASLLATLVPDNLGLSDMTEIALYSGGELVMLGTL